MLFQNYTEYLNAGSSWLLPSPPNNFLSNNSPVCWLYLKELSHQTKLSFLWNDIQWVSPSVTWDIWWQPEHHFLCMSEFWSFNLLVCEKKENVHTLTHPEKMSRGEGEERRAGGGETFQSSMQRTRAQFSPLCCWCGIYLDLRLLYFEEFPLPFSRASICSWVKDVLFLCSFRFSWSLIWASSESSPFELMELVFSPPPSCCWQPSATKRRGQ